MPIGNEASRYATTRQLVAKTLRGWIAKRCDTGPGFSAKSIDLYEDWKAHAVRSGSFPYSHKAFSQAMADIGYQSIRRSYGILIAGIDLRDPDREFKDRVAAEMAAQRIKDGEI